MASKPPVRSGNRLCDPPGRCIYCDSTEPPLTDEHLIPQGMRGTSYLPDASCEACRKITGEFNGFEGVVQRTMLRPLRKVHGMKGKKRKLEKAIDVTVVSEDGSEERASLPIDEIPFRAVLPTFQPPGLFRSADLAEQMTLGDVKITMVLHEPAAEKLRQRGFGGNRIEYPIPEFARMLAKIAHCNAVALFGLDGFTPFLREIIRGEQIETWPRFIGSVHGREEPPRRPKLAHRVSARLVKMQGDVFFQRSTGLAARDGFTIIVDITLFADLNVRPYEVITGWMPEAPEWTRKDGPPP